MKFSEEWAMEQLGKARGWQKQGSICQQSDPDDGPEADLQRKAEKWLSDHGFPFIHDRSRGKNRAGQILDLHIYLPAGRHVIVEFKVGANKLTKEQRKTIQQLLFLGHEFYEVRSWKSFVTIMNKKKE